MIRLCDVLLISRLRYHLPYTKVTQRQQMKLDALIRKGTKLAIGLPITTSTHRLLNMGYHNTVDELVVIRKRLQKIRLLLAPQGRHILTQLGHNFPPSPPPKEATLPTTTQQIERGLLSPVEIVWIPGHGGMPSNEKAHLLARETLHRAPDSLRSAQRFTVALPSLESYRQASRAFPPFTLTSHATKASSSAMPK
ncbi:hypothetical protein HPB47_016003, partial [Ixodes persulcatus]